MSTAAARSGNRLRNASDLTDRHFGRTVEVANLTGTLVGLLPVGDVVTLALVVGGARVWLPVTSDAHVEVHGRVA